MINNLIGLGTILLGATLAKKGGVKFFESSTYSDFKITPWLIDSVKSSEGLRSNAYYATDYERRQGQVTIGYGTCYLFYDDGRKVNTGYGLNKYASGLNGVKIGMTLQSLKPLFNSSESDEDFGVRLLRNYLLGSGTYSRIAKDLDSLGFSFDQRFSDVLLEMSYGSSGAYRPSIYYNNFLNVVRSNPSKIDLANAYVKYRYEYYYSQISRAQYVDAIAGLLFRLYAVGKWILGENMKVSDVQRLCADKTIAGRNAKLARLFMRDYFLSVSFNK